MCCVMPPASPSVTLVLRIASSSDVLPWSTWPMMVTTGGRGDRSSGLSGMSNRPSSTSAAATRFTVWPSSSATSWAVSASITSVILNICPCFISRRMTSTARSAMRLASSWMVIASGIVTSRTSFSLASLPAAPRIRRWVRRRNEATERSRTSPTSAAFCTVRRPRRFSPPAPRVGRAGAAGRARAPRRARTLVVVGLGNDLAQVEGRARGLRPGGRGGGLGLRLAVAEALRRLPLGALFRLLLVAAAILLLALARFGGLALALLDGLPFAAAGLLCLGDAAFLGLAYLGAFERAHARGVFLRGELRQHQAAGALGRGGRGRRRWRRRGAARSNAAPAHGTASGGTRGWCGGGRRLRLHVGPAALHLLDHHRLGAAVAEALLHDALLDPGSLERQGSFGRGDRQFLAGMFRLSHSNPTVGVCCSGLIFTVNLRPRGPVQAPGGAREHASAPSRSRWRGPRAGQHVPHLVVQVPNPIGPT